MLRQIFKVTERMDSAGMQLKHVFLGQASESDPADEEADKPNPQSDVNRELLSLWIRNLEVWGSYEPISSQCYDIELTRAQAYTKLCQLRKRLEVMADFWH